MIPVLFALMALAIVSMMMSMMERNHARAAERIRKDQHPRYHG